MFDTILCYKCYDVNKISLHIVYNAMLTMSTLLTICKSSDNVNDVDTISNEYCKYRNIDEIGWKICTGHGCELPFKNVINYIIPQKYPFQEHWYILNENLKHISNQEFIDKIKQTIPQYYMLMCNLNN